MNLVEKEWHARKEHGLPPYHSVDASDVGFKFVKPNVPDPGFQCFLSGDYSTMEEHFQGKRDVRQVVTLKELPTQVSYNLPEVQTIILNAQVANKTAFLCCDGRYFRDFGAKLLASIKGPAHVHLMDADPSYAKKVIKQLDRVVGLTIEQPRSDPAYYHSVRFIRWFEFMKSNGCTSVLLDVDAIANRCHTELPDAEVGMRLRPGRLEPWNVCNASVCIGRANAYWKGVADYIYHFYVRNQLIWQIDQAALWAVWKKQKPEITVLGPKEVDYDYQDDGIIWCNSGARKFDDDDPARAKFRDKFDRVKVALTDEEEEREQLKTLHIAAKSALKKLRVEEAKRLYLRLLRRSFHGLPGKPEYIGEPTPDARKVEKILYLPVEIAARELPAREWLAETMHTKGFQVVVGNRWQMQNWHNLPPGIILWKSANTQDVGVFNEAINSGHIIALMDEELFPMQPRIDLYRPSLDTRCLDRADIIFAHNEKQKELYEKMTKTPVVVTGNPRSLLISTAEKGDRVIICTMAGTVNNFGRSFQDMVSTTVRILGGATEKTFDFLAYQINHEINGYVWTRQAIKDCRSLKPLIRCHPSEDVSFWSDFGEIDDRTPFNQRLNDAKCIVHVSGCGTGLDATLAGVPTVRLGEGGHGLSAKFGTGYTDDIETKVARAKAKRKPEFNDVTLPVALEALQRQHAFSCPFDIARAYKAQDFKPTEFHENKFPMDPKGTLIGWRTALWN